MTRTIVIIAMTCLLALAGPAMGKKTAEPITISVLEAAQMLASQPKEVFLVDGAHPARNTP